MKQGSIVSIKGAHLFKWGHTFDLIMQLHYQCQRGRLRFLRTATSTHIHICIYKHTFTHENIHITLGEDLTTLVILLRVSFNDKALSLIAIVSFFYLWLNERGGIAFSECWTKFEIQTSAVQVLVGVFVNHLCTLFPVASISIWDCLILFDVSILQSCNHCFGQ